MKINLIQNYDLSLCDYQKCDYKCKYIPNKKKYNLDELDLSTFTKDFAIEEIEIIMNHIKDLFKKNIVYDIEKIVTYIQSQENTKYIELKYIYIALEKMINEKVLVKNPLDKSGYIIYRDVYYIFQPSDVRLESIPILYRLMPKEKLQKRLL